jgi:hypothetical protein
VPSLGEDAIFRGALCRVLPSAGLCPLRVGCPLRRKRLSQSSRSILPR